MLTKSKVVQFLLMIPVVSACIRYWRKKKEEQRYRERHDSLSDDMMYLIGRIQDTEEANEKNSSSPHVLAMEQMTSEFEVTYSLKKRSFLVLVIYPFIYKSSLQWEGLNDPAWYKIQFGMVSEDFPNFDTEDERDRLHKIILHAAKYKRSPDWLWMKPDGVSEECAFSYLEAFLDRYLNIKGELESRSHSKRQQWVDDQKKLINGRTEQYRALECPVCASTGLIEKEHDPYYICESCSSDLVYRPEKLYQLSPYEEVMLESEAEVYVT